MFAVITAHSIPDHVQGYISRFFTEIEAGVYVGVTSPPVIDNLWDRVVTASCEGSVVLITSDPRSEQGFKVAYSRVENARILNDDGLQLISRRESGKSIE